MGALPVAEGFGRMMSLHDLPRRPESIRDEILSRDAREIRHLWKVLNRYGLPL